MHYSNHVGYTYKLKELECISYPGSILKFGQRAKSEKEKSLPAMSYARGQCLPPSWKKINLTDDIYQKIES